MEFILSYNNNEGLMLFPVINNGSVSLARDQDNPTFEGQNGQIQALGTTNLASFTVESIFPLHRYSWIQAGSWQDDGWRYVDTINAVRERRIPFRAIYLDDRGEEIFNLPVSVVSFEYGLDRAKDIAFRLECREYRFANTPNTASLSSQSSGSGTNQATRNVQTESQAAASKTPDGVERRYTSTDATMVAKVMSRVTGTASSKTKMACVAWTILNRKDSGNYGATLYDVITQKGAFDYQPGASTMSSSGYDLLALATDVMDRWSREKSSQTDVGRVLPKTYKWYVGTGNDIKFGNGWPVPDSTIWDYSLPSPYEN